MSSIHAISGQIVDLHNRRIFAGEVVIQGGVVQELRTLKRAPQRVVMPGFIDAHVHVESSMLVPSEFARMACVHGTVATVSDPHEIANVLGLEGVRFMIRNASRVPFKFFFGAPSCVPATTFETAGAVLGQHETEELLDMPEIRYLSEMMNFPGVLNNDPAVCAKVEAAKRRGKPVDGHAPGVRGDAARRYAEHGITTDHECVLYDEAVEKIRCGMKILIREGSAAKNFDALVQLIDQYPEMVMFCSDDKHPNDLIRGHINELVLRALQRGCDLFNVLRAAALNPILHYALPVGTLQPGSPADFIVVENLQSLKVRETWIAGVPVSRGRRTLIPRVEEQPINNFNCLPISEESLRVPVSGTALRVIDVYDGQLVTGSRIVPPLVRDGEVVSDLARDIIKLVVVNRYRAAPPAVAFVSNTGLSRGALASSIAHDSHNIVACGASDHELVAAINAVIEQRGGIAVSAGRSTAAMPLPVAGLMSLDEGPKVASRYAKFDRRARELGTTLSAPFMTLSFLALLVIPELKLSDRGLFDAGSFSFAPLLA